MKVKKQFGEFDKKEVFNLNKSGGTLLKNIPDGTEFKVDRAIIITDEYADKATGEVKEKDILHIICGDEAYSTESPTVMETFENAVEYMETVNLKFRLIRQSSKNGRVFMDFDLI